MPEPDWIAGEPDSTTRCLMCPARTPGKDTGWGWLIPSEQPRHIFAGYFCSDSCTEKWRKADDHQRMICIWGTKENESSPAKGYRLLAQIAEGYYVQGNDEDAQQVPIFALRLPPLEAVVEIEWRGPFGRIVKLTHSAPFPHLGWREPVKNGSIARLW